MAQEKFLLNLTIPKKKDTFQIFLLKKNPRIDNFKPKNILRSSPSLEIQCTLPAPQAWKNTEKHEIL